MFYSSLKLSVTRFFCNTKTFSKYRKYSFIDFIEWKCNERARGLMNIKNGIGFVI